MAYTPTVWNNGDVITAERLNKLEHGVENEQVGPQGPIGPQGAKGEKGDAGASAGFGVISATVDSSTGTPSASVTTSGENTALNVVFKFSGLKGDKGDKGDVGPQGPPGESVAGVSSFNGRTGAVAPQAGDYTAADVGAVPATRTVDGKALSGDISILPAGGSAGQILAKNSEVNYDTKWIDAPSGGGGGGIQVVDITLYADNNWISTSMYAVETYIGYFGSGSSIPEELHVKKGSEIAYIGCIYDNSTAAFAAKYGLYVNVMNSGEVRIFTSERPAFDLKFTVIIQQN